MHCQFVGTTEAAQGQKVSIADFFKKDWKMKEVCSKAFLKKEAKDMFEAEAKAKQCQGKQEELLKTEIVEKKGKGKGNAGQEANHGQHEYQVGCFIGELHCALLGVQHMRRDG